MHIAFSVLHVFHDVDSNIHNLEFFPLFLPRISWNSVDIRVRKLRSIAGRLLCSLLHSGCGCQLNVCDNIPGDKSRLLGSFALICSPAFVPVLAAKRLLLGPDMTSVGALHVPTASPLTPSGIVTARPLLFATPSRIQTGGSSFSSPLL